MSELRDDIISDWLGMARIAKRRGDRDAAKRYLKVARLYRHASGATK